MNRYRTPRLLLVGLAALIVEMTAGDAFSWGGARPELVMLAALYAALFARDPGQGMVACWSLGLLKDLGSAGPPGWHALLFLLAAAFVTRIRLLVYRDHVATQLVCGAAGAALLALATALCVSITAGSIPAGVWAGRTLASAVLTGLAAPLVVTALAEAKFLGR